MNRLLPIVGSAASAAFFLSGAVLAQTAGAYPETVPGAYPVSLPAGDDNPVGAGSGVGGAPPSGPAAVAPAATSAAEPAAAAPASGPADGFTFGTYGRVGIGWDGRGGSTQPFSVVSHGPRLEQPAYLELDFGYRLTVRDDINLRMLTTVAVFDDLFHYTGDPVGSLAIRNLYLETEIDDRWRFWAGSRMARGDDIYLFDWWPLDNLNTVGGGAAAAFGDFRLAAHVGMNRLDDEWQTQWLRVPDPVFGTREILTLDRPRTVASLKAEYFSIQEAGGDLGWKVLAYAEGHFVPEGTLRRPDLSEETLPDDQGWMIGVQGGLWSDEGDYLNLFVRGAGGLAAYGEMAVPFGVDQAKRALDAREFLVAASGNLEFGDTFGLLGGLVGRYFQDADRNEFDNDDAWEFALALRPHLYVNHWFHLAAEISCQLRRPGGLSPETGADEIPQIFKFALIPMVVPLGPGTLSRPQIRLLYQISVPNDAARHTYPEDDPRRLHDVEHLIGLQVEWWYNSSYR